MPLIKSASKEAREANIKTEIASGKPIKQAVAIGYSQQREAKHKMSSAPSAKPMRKTGRGR